MKNILRNEGDLGIFLLNQDLLDLEKGKSLKSFLLNDSHRRLDTQIHLSFYNNGVSIKPFIDVFNLMAKENFKIILNYSDLSSLKDPLQNGIIQSLENDLMIYSENYEFFNIIYNYICDMEQCNNAY